MTNFLVSSYVKHRLSVCFSVKHAVLRIICFVPGIYIEIQCRPVHKDAAVGLDDTVFVDLLQNAVIGYMRSRA